MPIKYNLPWLATLSLACGACNTGAVMDVEFPSYAEAKRNSAIELGWVPDWIPASSTALHEAHGLNTTKSMMNFSFPPKTELRLPPSCHHLNDASTVPPPPFRRAWWPADLPSSSSTASPIVYWQCGLKTSPWYTAVDTASYVGYVWDSRDSHPNR